MSILVTGATGFVGGAVARALAERGEEVHALVRSESKAAPLGEMGVHLFGGTLANPTEIHRAAEGCRAVIHCAGLTNPRSTLKALGWTHVAGTENVIKAAEHAGCSRMIHVSCANVTLHNGDRVTWNSSHQPPREPVGHHAQTKLLSEAIVVSHMGRLETMAVRPPLVWGAGDCSRLPAFCKELRAGGIRLVGDGDTLMATIHIDNLVQALLGGLEAEDIRGRTFYVNDPEMHTSATFLRALSTALGGPPPRRGTSFGMAHALAKVRQTVGRGGLTVEDVLERGRSSYFDHQAAMQTLGYAPEPLFDSGMNALAEWVHERGGVESLASQHKAPLQDADVVDQIASAPGPD